ncbi:hypothetical protein AYI68_g1715 [Smittium mucronatum]|uniref:Uncharacterized protein n=1 Tax=Smittium mucronatum TaxID=133383 RepID=A0A1R0H501_9FUNG|nr:hypothetical protein AYI68_g1715 [Smittium mucronatum]
MRERRPEEEPLDPFVSTRIPVTDLAVCPELSKALPTSSMNHSPPPLNDSAPVSVKKVYFVLYGIKLAPAQVNRQIDYFVHRRIQDSPGIGTADDPETYFASTMRALLSDIAATINQARLNNLHKGMDLPGKPIQLVPSYSRSLMNQEDLDTLIFKKPAVKRQSSALLQVPEEYVPKGRVQQKHCYGAEQQFCNDCQTNSPLPRPSVWTIPKSFNLHKDSPSSFRTVQIERNEDICVSGKPPDYGREKESVFERDTHEFIYVPVPKNHPSKNGDKYQRNETESSFMQDSGCSTRSQQTSERCENYIEVSGKLYRERPVDAGCNSSWQTNASLTSGAQEPLSFYTEFMGVDGDPDESSNRKPIILEERAEFMELSLVLAENSRNGDIYRLQRHRMGSCNGPPGVLGIVDKIGGEDAHHRQGNFDRIIDPEAKEREVRRNNLYETTGNHRENLVALPQDQHSPSRDIFSIGLKPNGCTEQFDCSNRMFSISRDIIYSEYDAWPIHRGSVCLMLEQEDREIIQLVHRQKSARTELSGLQMVKFQKSLRLPALEHDRADSTEVSHMVSGSGDALGISTPLATSH